MESSQKIPQGVGFDPRLLSCEPYIVKIGGSLYSDTNLPDLLARLIDANPRILIVPGGGRFADEIRELTHRFAIGDESAHWLAISAMDLAARFLQSVEPRIRVIDSPPDWLGSADRAQPSVIAVGCLRNTQWGDELPVGWHVTSDSIAAYVAKWTGASRLLLCKSVGMQEPLRLEEAVAAGWVDPHFPVAAAGLHVDWLNARTGHPTTLLW